MNNLSNPRPPKSRFWLPMLAMLCLSGLRAQTATEIILYADPNYGGQSVTLGIGSYPDLSATGFPLNTLSSYKIGADVVAYPHSCLNFGNGGNMLNAFTMFSPDVLAQNPSLAGNVWDGIVFGPHIGCSGSTLVDNDTKSLLVLGKNCTPGPNEVALFDGAGYTRGCKLVGVGDYEWMPDAGLVNDWATSLKVGANVKVSVFHDIAFGGSTTTYSKGTNVPDLAATIGGNNLSSFKVALDPARTWNNNTGNNQWSTPGNWTGPPPPPTASDPVAFNATSPSTVNLDVDVVISSLDVADDYPGTINMGSHEIAVSTGISIPKPPSLNAGTGTIKLTKGQPVNIKPPLHNLIFSTTTPAPFNILKTLAVKNKLTINSPVTMLNNGGGEEVEVEGDLEINVPQPPPPSPLTNAPITIKGTLNQNVKTKGLPHIKLKKPSGQAILSDNSEAQSLEVVSGTLNLNQKTLTVPTPVSFPPSSTLTGSGSFNSPQVEISPDAALSPGNSPGTMTIVGDLQMQPSANLIFEIAPAGVDMVAVQGAVSIGGANLDLQPSAPTPPPSITVIDNDAMDPVSGTFAGMPEGSPVAVGAAPYHISYTGGTGNDVTLTANVAPVAICQNVVVFAGSNCQASITANDVNDGSYDPDGDPITLTVSPSGPFGLGLHIVVLTVSDGFGGINFCTAIVTVEDNTLPSAVCQNITVPLIGASAGITAAQISNGSSDNCGSITLAASPTGFDCGNVGENTVVLTVTDASGNTATCASTVTVEDNTLPTAVCQNITVPLAGASASITASQINNGSSDNCGFTLSASPTSFDCSNVGPNAVTLTVTDASGNSATCASTVTVEDDTPPTITCPGNIVVNTAPGLCSAPVTYAVTASDNCSYTIVRTGGLASGAQFPVGTTTNSFTASDPSGNTATCSFTVTVLKIGDPGLLYAYTVIGKDDVKMKTNTVQSGGVGVVNAGKKAKLEQNTLVTAANTFVKAPVLDLHSGSVVTTYHAGQVAAGLLPAFLPNNSPGNNDENIPDNSGPVTLNLASYGKITVGKNVVATFSGNASVLVKELKLKEGAAILFDQNTNVLIDKKLDGDKDVTINNSGQTVWIYVEDDVKIDEGSDVSANIYSDKNLKVEKAKINNTTNMTGLFIAEKVDSKEYVYWNWDPASCPGAPPMGLVANVNALTFYAEKKDLTTKIQWFTRSGQTNDYFTVERSANELDWHPIGKVEGEGPADELMVFNEADLDPLSGDNFYRLRLVSRDGSERLSDVRKVAFPDGFLAVYPNPNGGDVLFTALSEFAGQAAHVEISNAIGNVLQSRDFTELPAAEIGWDIAHLTSGTYFISVKIPGKRPIVKRFTVQRL